MFATSALSAPLDETPADGAGGAGAAGGVGGGVGATAATGRAIGGEKRGTVVGATVVGGTVVFTLARVVVVTERWIVLGAFWCDAGCKEEDLAPPQPATTTSATVMRKVFRMMCSWSHRRGGPAYVFGASAGARSAGRRVCGVFG
jgi:hypothetical protein